MSVAKSDRKAKAAENLDRIVDAHEAACKRIAELERERDELRAALDGRTGIMASARKREHELLAENNELRELVREVLNAYVGQRGLEDNERWRRCARKVLGDE